MSSKTKRYFLQEDEIPKQWYNIMADMPNKPLPPLNPKTKKPLAPETAKFLRDIAWKTVTEFYGWK